MNNKVTLRGKDDVAKALQELVGRSQEVKREVLFSALAIQKEAKQRLRDYEAIDTGNLRNTIIVEVDGRGLTAEIGPTAKYGPFVEFGARPHFPPMDALEDWARKHGFKSAWPICKAIARRGLSQKPYLNPAFDAEESKFMRRIQAIYERSK